MSRRGNRHFKKQLNNQGFSLLELLVVIAIIAVVSLLVTVGLTVLNKGNAKKANKNLYSSLSELKTSTMAKNGNWLVNFIQLLRLLVKMEILMYLLHIRIQEVH